MIDKSVTCVTVSEADGIITNLDCYNLKLFEKSNKILYMVPYKDYTIHTIHTNDTEPKKYDDYQTWIIFYKLYIERKYFS